MQSFSQRVLLSHAICPLRIATLKVSTLLCSSCIRTLSPFLIPTLQTRHISLLKTNTWSSLEVATQVTTALVLLFVTERSLLQTLSSFHSPHQSEPVTIHGLNGLVSTVLITATLKSRPTWVKIRANTALCL